MDKSIGSLEMQVWNLGLQYATKLENFDYSTFIDTQPKLAIGHIIHRISHDKLQRRMKLTFNLEKDVMKADYNNFFRETAKESRAMDRHEAASASYRGGSDSDEAGSKVKRSYSKAKIKKKKNQKRDHDKTAKGDASEKLGTSVKEDSGSNATKRSRPNCLNPKCKNKSSFGNVT